MKHIFIGRTREGKVSISQKSELNQAMAMYPEFTLTLEKKKKKRSLSQNNFYWACVVNEEIQCFKEFWGEIYTLEQIHDWNKNNFWADEEVVRDEVVKKPCSSSDNTTTQWEEKVELIRQWFRIKFDWEIPYPSEQTELKYKD